VLTGDVSPLERGEAALGSGDWEAARRAFTDAITADPTPAARFGLANALWWLGRVGEAIDEMEAAYAGFIRTGDVAAAVNVAVFLSLTYNANLGNRVASAGWASRAARLAADLDAPPLSAWVELARAATTDDPVTNEALSREALAVARTAGDRDLELCSLSTLGSALVDQGRADEGTALLDEAMAGSIGGEVTDPSTVVFTSCVLMQSCYRCADFPRIVQWVHVLERFVERYGCPYVHSTCRGHYGAVLVATGDWRRAEDELQTALGLAGRALPAVRAEVLAFLAELRLAQGRVDEATELLTGVEDQPAVVPVLAAAQLAAGNDAVAVATAERRRAAAMGRRLEGARLGEVVGEARLAAGDAERAAEEARRLVEAGAETGCALIRARGERLLGRALARTGDPASRSHLEAALDDFARLEMPLEAARTRLALARACHHERPEVAVSEGRAALGAFEDLGARRDADEAAAWLRDAGVPVGRVAPRGAGTLTRREVELLGLLADGLSNPEIADRLYISRRTVEHHVASIFSKLGLRNRAEAAAFATSISMGASSRRNG
jgi:DNA-binding CsgD family transcriptional regulator